MLQRPGSSWGFGVLLKDTSVVVLKEERALVIHSPTNNPCRTWDSNPQPLDYKSDSLTIRPHQWFNRNFMKLWEYFLCAKKTNIMTLFNDFFSPGTVCHHYREYHDACVLCCWHRTRMRCHLFTSRGMHTHLCSEDERMSHGFGMTWVINDTILILGELCL